MAMATTILILAAATSANLLNDIALADRRADAQIAAGRSVIAPYQAAWLNGIGGLPVRTPLNAQEGPITMCDGFTLQNILFESQPGVYVVGHLALPTAHQAPGTAHPAPFGTPPHPVVLMPMGHSDNGILNPRYAAHLAMMARAGFACFAWDPLAQGERRQSQPRFDYTDNCSTEHTRLGFRGWLVGWNFARFRIWDGIRALDYITTRRDIDGTRVGICGTSGGGTMSAYLQALDPRITVAFPNCFVSSIRAVFAERGCHDAEQFFWNQLNVGVNHAVLLAMGLGRVTLATGSRWKDYFPHVGAVETFATYSNLWARLAATSPLHQAPCTKHQAPNPPHQAPSTKHPALLPWHFHCDGPHGLPLPTRQAQVDWMRYGLANGPRPKPLQDYWALSTGDHSGAHDPCTSAPLPFPTNAAFFTASHQVRDLPGFRSLYDILADRARELAHARQPKSRETLREIVRRRAGIRPLSEICNTDEARTLPFDHPRFDWWYLKGAYGCRRENEAAMLATLGRSVVGREAERIIRKAAHQAPGTTHPAPFGTPHQAPAVPLRAAGWDCIAAAHAYAAEPQLFSSVEFTNPPPSWTDMVTNPDPKDDSFAIAVWGALEDYDWPDLVKSPSPSPSPTSTSTPTPTPTSTPTPTPTPPLLHYSTTPLCN